MAGTALELALSHRFLMKYPYSIVKIDKSMIWACDTNPKALVSLKHTVAMIKDLKMSVLAEGDETEIQIQYHFFYIELVLLHLN